MCVCLCFVLILPVFFIFSFLFLSFFLSPFFILLILPSLSYLIAEWGHKASVLCRQISHGLWVLHPIGNLKREKSHVALVYRECGYSRTNAFSFEVKRHQVVSGECHLAGAQDHLCLSHFNSYFKTITFWACVVFGPVLCGIVWWPSVICRFIDGGCKKEKSLDIATDLDVQLTEEWPFNIIYSDCQCQFYLRGNVR